MSNNITRRRALQIAAGTSASGLLVGGASGKGRPPRRIVGTASSRGSREARRQASNVRRTLRFGDIGQAVAGRFSDKAAEQLRRRDDVRYVERDATVEALGQRLPWGVDRVDADVLHEHGETGSGADVAIIDTGIDADHPDLQANLGAGVSYVDCQGSDCDRAWSDDNDHGTHCAGVAAAVDDSEGVVGVATQATLHAVKVLDENGSGYLSDVAAGIEHTADQGWDVGNLSLGASSGSRTLRDACRYAADEGVLLVAAAGNSGPCTDCVGYPAVYDTVVAVGSTDADDALSSFSATGPELELAAPGEGVESTVRGGYASYSGTSMACPHVSGAAAQLMAGGYTNREARQRLHDTAEDVGLDATEQGYGLLDADAAVLDGSGDDDSAPSVSWANPSGGSTVSGTVAVRIDAADAEDADDSLEVSYRVDSGAARSTAYDATSGTYTAEWDTTTVDDGDHALEATATDAAGNTDSASIAVTVDNAGAAPSVDALSLSEVETDGGDAAFDADWSVADADGDLASVDLTLVDDADGETEDGATVEVGGDAAGGTTRLVAPGDDGSEHGYTVELIVSDGEGNASSAAASATEEEPTTSTAPDVDSFRLSDQSNPAWTRYDVEWSVADADGDLGSVTTEMVDGSGRVLDAASDSVGGDVASGTHQVRSKRNASAIVLTVTDAAGHATTDSRSV
ncbi:S8 family serine peptidase [Natronomonas salina]|uniref:S8 family serine peptidase n=1 Tax=Natronomonas salina TaxID=1710540 RepID=UPI0015B76837|nr:S8 family serine peptidase [Natronomonas salina]QLD89342.1 S8 family serine peptidase [Natronomonas salina]